MDFISIIQHWLKDPTVEKLIQVCIAILVITLIVRALSNSVPRYIQDNDTRYHLRKTINFIGYGLIFLFAASIFSDNFRQLTVIFGVIGAGVAFALQERGNCQFCRLGCYFFRSIL
ncbi:hypothetical protein [Nostoc sp.]|uniref:hypothetical protein n=1 Tax=Nostoc sp. TaxID=1180 RepID=UPI002FEE8F3B